MTREEAIARIKDHKDIHKMNEPRAILISEALDMAIEALKQEPCDDAISRQAVDDLFQQAIESKSANLAEYWKKLIWIREHIKDLPSVNPQPNISEDGTLTVHVKDGSKVSRVLVCGDNHWGGLYYPEQEPKTGHWVDILTKDNKIIAVRCSYCQNSPKHAIKSDFCPNCGAKMEVRANNGRP